MGSCLMATVSVWEDEKILEMDSGDGYITISMYIMPFNCTLKNGKFYIMCILPNFKNYCLDT